MPLIVFGELAKSEMALLGYILESNRLDGEGKWLYRRTEYLEWCHANGWLKAHEGSVHYPLQGLREKGVISIEACGHRTYRLHLTDKAKAWLKS